MASASRFSLTPHTRAVLAMALAVVLFLAVNLMTALGLRSVRADLTEQSLYTLTEGSKSIIRDIPEPITIRVYRTQELIDAVPLLQSYAPQVMQTLQTFERLADGQIRLEVIETAPFSAEEDQAIGFGLAGFNLNRSGERGYFGLVGTNSLDTLEVIPFLDPVRQSFLQYDLARLVHRLSQPVEIRVAIIDGLSMFGSRAKGHRPWAILDLLSREFALMRVPPDVTAIPDTDVLLVTHPAQLSPQQQYAIDQYVLGGGAALVMIDPLAEYSPPDPQNPNRPQDPSSDLAPLLAAWGLKMDSAHVVGDRNMAMETVGMAGQQRVVADYLPWLRVDGGAFNDEEPITARLEAMRLSSAGALEILPDATTSVTPLLQTTDQSMLLDRDTVMARPNPNRLLEGFIPSGQRYVLAARVSGPARTAFTDGPPVAEGQSPLPEGATPIKESNGPINVVVVADTDLLADSHIVSSDGRISTSNADFILNAIGDLAGGDALIGVRGGRVVNRVFTRVEEMRDRAEAAYRSTELRLTEEMADIQQKLVQLQGIAEAGGADAMRLSQQRQAAVAEANQRLAEVRQQLRDVRHALRAEIDALDRTLKFLNIALIPILLIVATALVALWRNIRLRCYLQRQTADAGTG
mgnify:FL=1